MYYIDLGLTSKLPTVKQNHGSYNVQKDVASDSEQCDISVYQVSPISIRYIPCEMGIMRKSKAQTSLQ